jgi:hypothetical protein
MTNNISEVPYDARGYRGKQGQRGKIPLPDFKQTYRLTQAELAEMFALSQGTISDKLRKTANGTHRCSVKKVNGTFELYEEKTIGVGTLPWL